MLFSYSNKSLTIYFILCILYSANALSFELNYNYTAAVKYTDNSLLTHVNKLDELPIVATAGISLSESSSRFNYLFSPSVTQIKYTNNTLSDKNYYRLNSGLEFDIIPSFLNFKVYDNFSVQEIDQQLSNLPSNKQQVNIFSVGPSIALKVNSTNKVLLNFTYYDIENEITNTDNKREFYSAAIEHAISTASNISLNYSDMLIKYNDITANTNTIKNSIFINFNSRKARSIYNILLGKSKSTRIIDKQFYEGDLLTFSWDYTVNFSTNIFASYRKELSDAVTDVNLSNQLNSGIINTAKQTNSDIFRAERIFISYAYQASRYNGTVSIFGVKQDYETTQVDQKTLGSNILSEYKITNRISLIGKLKNLFIKQLSNIEVQYTNSSYSIGARYKLSNNFYFDSRYTNNIRRSNITTTNYDENVFSLNVLYSSKKKQRVRNRN